MSTIRQRKLARAIVENLDAEEPLNKKELVISSGYAVKTAQGHAPEIIEQRGVQEELAALGFTEDAAKRVVAEILANSDERANDRLKAAELTFKVHGSFAPDKHVNVNMDVDATSEIKELTDKLNALHRGTGIAGDGGPTSTVGTEVQNQE